MGDPEPTTLHGQMTTLGAEGQLQLYNTGTNVQLADLDPYNQPSPIQRTAPELHINPGTTGPATPRKDNPQEKTKFPRPFPIQSHPNNTIKAEYNTNITNDN